MNYKIEIRFQSNRYNIEINKVFGLPYIPRAGELFLISGDGWLADEDFKNHTKDEIEQFGFWECYAIIERVVHIKPKWIFLVVDLDYEQHDNPA